MVSYKHEIWRKLIHLSSLWMVAAIWWLEREEALLLFAGVTMLVFIADSARGYFPLYRGFYARLFGNILRKHEDNGSLTGAFYVPLAAFLSVLLFSGPLAMAALAVMLLADSAAALIGRKYGRHKLLDKSVEGTAAFFATSFIVISVFYPISEHWLPATVASGGASAAELYSKKLGLDDNLTIPLCIGAVMTMFSL